jgi:FkbM family methyltransferase
MRTDGRAHFPRFEKLATRLRLGLRKALEVRVVVVDGDDEYTLVCQSLDEVVRARRLIAREEGTVVWLREELRPGDVFYDVGANIGAFTLIAARSLAAEGHVYAFEPHPANLVSLERNIVANDRTDRVSILPLALAAEPCRGTFVAPSSAAGTANSTFVPGEVGHGSSAQITFATSVDALIEEGTIRPPDLVKIDVDGAESEVFRGMRRLLARPDRPRSVQVEVNRARRDELLPMLDEAGYELSSRHHSAAGLTRLAAGAAGDEVAYNGIFRPRY